MPEAPPPQLPSLTQFDFHSRLEGMTGVVLVAFTSRQCGACRHLEGVLRAVAQRYPEWRLFEVDAGHEPGLVNEFEVFHLPSVFLYWNGQFHCQLQAEARPDAIVAAIHVALQQPAREAP